jgi:hypothetical protein
MPIAAAAVLLLLAGCSAGPSHDAVAERFRIELEGATDGLIKQDDPATIKLASGLADDALDGQCGQPGYWSGLEEQPSLVYAWGVTCDMYFSDEMSQTQRDYVRGLLLERVADDVTG